MTAYETSLRFYNLFFTGQKKRLSLIEWLDNSTCDEIARFNLDKNEIDILYHCEGKYYPSLYDGTYRDLYRFTLHNIVHPDDRAIYEDLMDPDHLLEKLKKSKTKNFRFAQFRLKLVDETYRYIEHCVITGPENGIKEGDFKLYIFDIQNMISREKGESADDKVFYANFGKDNITGLYLDKYFFSKAQNVIDYEKKKKWCLVSIDIEHFNLFDEWYGREIGDQILKTIGNILIDYRKKHGGVAGYFGQDDFALVVPHSEKSIEKLYDEIRLALAQAGSSVGFSPCFGIALLENSNGVVDAFDKASIAVDNAKKSFKHRIFMYDPNMQIRAEKEYQIVADFMQALKNNEITFYLQPQCRISTKAIVGAESLSRWFKKDGTYVPPGAFIPVLEKYGFIPDLDLYIWDKVFAWVKSCIKRNIPVVPISLNVSQVDIITIDVACSLEKLLNKYQLDPRLFKIEITESAYAEETEIVDNVISKLRKIGFSIFMDDFGSGYSSLNRLGNLKFEAIKLDGQFLIMDDYKKSIHIIESMVNMAKTMSTPIIVEGVETQEQADFLKSIGVQYIQGYFFYRPIPISEFEKLVSAPNQIDQRGFGVKINEQFRIREFMDENIYSDSMLNSILGPVAIYTLNKDDDSVDIVRFNQQFFEVVDVPDFQQRLHAIENYMPEEDRPVIVRIMKEAVENRLNGAMGTFRFYKTDGTLTNFLIHFFCLGELETCYRFYGKATNITDLIESKIQMRLLNKYTNISFVFFKVTNGAWSYKVGVHGASTEMQMDTEQFERELNNKKYYERVDKDEVARVKSIIENAITDKKNYEFQFTLIRDDGTRAKFMVVGDPVDDSNTNVAYIITFRPL